MKERKSRELPAVADVTTAVAIGSTTYRPSGGAAPSEGRRQRGKFVLNPERKRSTRAARDASARHLRDITAGFNRRMRKTARPVVWEGHGAQSP